jgi:hypothetical protein
VVIARLKPLVKTRRPPFLIRRHGGVLISRTLEELLFRCADVLSEGNTRLGSGGQGTYFGSTMISIAFAKLESEAHTDLSKALRAELLSAVEGSVRVRLRAMRLARAEATRRAQWPLLGTAMCEVRMRDSGKQLHIDVDLEVELRVSSRAKRS